MNWYVKRTGQALFTLVSVVTLTFVLAWTMPGNLIDRLLGQMLSGSGSADPEVVRQTLINNMMFDPNAPLHEAFLTYLSSLAEGNLGYSFTAQQNLNSLMAEAVPWTLLVMSLAVLGLFTTSLSLGAIMAYKEGSMFDLGNTMVGILTTSIPYYVAAVLLIIYVGYGEGPITGHFPVAYRRPEGVEVGLTLEFVVGALRHATLPALSYVLTQYGLLALSMRGNSIQVLGEDYVRVAKLRGLPERRIALRYVGRNAILPLYTSLLLALAFMFAASVILEELFQYYGVGWYLNRGIRNRDVPLMMATFMVITVSVVIATFVADLTYSKVDPRIKSGETGESY